MTINVQQGSSSGSSNSVVCNEFPQNDNFMDSNSNACHSSETEESHDYDDEFYFENNSIDDNSKQNIDFKNNLMRWANEFNIKQNALKSLLDIINKRLPNILPQDPRTLLNTNKTINLLSVASG